MARFSFALPICSATLKRLRVDVLVALLEGKLVTLLDTVVELEVLKYDGVSALIVLVLVVAGVGRLRVADDEVEIIPGLPPSRIPPMLLMAMLLPGPGCVEPREDGAADVAPVATLPVFPKGVDVVEEAPSTDTVPIPSKEAVNRG